MNCSHKDCLVGHWVRLSTGHTMALEPEASEMRLAAQAIYEGRMTVVECLMDDEPIESVGDALSRIAALGRPRPAPSPESQDTSFIGCLHPPKR